MNAWAQFWGVTLAVAMGVFSIMAIVVAIGGFRDVAALFRALAAGHEERASDEE